MTTNDCINTTNKHQHKLHNSKKTIYIPLPIWYHLTCPGDVAQLGERDNRTVEARGSSPLISTSSLCKSPLNALQIAKAYGIV